MRSRSRRAFPRQNRARSKGGPSWNARRLNCRTRKCMAENQAAHVRDRVDAIYRSDSRRVLATLIRLLGDFDLAEEALHDAFTAAVERWPRDGVPASPRAWLVSTGRFKAIDRLRKTAKFESADT